MPTSSNDPSGFREVEYNDERYGDIYRIRVDADGSFVSAKRLLDGDPTDVIHYDSMSEMNPYHQHQIHELLCKLQRKKK